ncbi:MAG: ECF transporter S component [Ruminococcaceae bacterium]|nr:ECF transporter S component [Oscillospiraceae bacterium]
MNPHIKKSIPVRKLVVTAMLAALSSVLMMLSFSVPFVPSFLKLDFSELPALLASFTFGPVYGILVCLVKNLVNVFFTTTGGIGELANFLLGTLFVLPAGLIYKQHRTLKGAVTGALVGNTAMAIISLPVNYFLTYPIYMKFLSEEAILGMYKAIYPGTDTLIEALTIFNIPFTFVKGLFSVIITFLIYKRISPLLKGRK